MDRLSGWLGRWRLFERRRFPVSTSPIASRMVPIALLVLLAGALLANIAYLHGRPGLIPNDDVFAYDCYARAFWRGTRALIDSPLTRYCGDHRWLFWTAPPQAFHTFPREYPAPALAVFSLPLLWPFGVYAVTYMVILALLVFGLACYLVRRGLPISACAFALYTLIGGWGTALERYDLVPGILVLGALVSAERGGYGKSAVQLACAALLKVYPGCIAPVIAVRAWRQHRAAPYREAFAFLLVLLLGLLPFAMLNVAGLAGPLSYNGLRPPQIESVPGSLLWLGDQLGGGARIKLTFHSVNVVGRGSDAVAMLATLLFFAAVVLVCFRAWLTEDSMGRLVVLSVLVMLCTSKVLSPQYMLWLFPVVAYVEGLRLRWLMVAVLTLAIFPYGYTLDASLVRLPQHPFFMACILTRNALLVAITIGYLIGYTKEDGLVSAREHSVHAEDERVPREGVAERRFAPE